MEALLLEIKQMVQNQSKEIRDLKNTVRAFQLKELDATAAAAHLGCTVKTIYNLVNLGKVKSFKKGKFLYFTRSELDRYLEEN